MASGFRTADDIGPAELRWIASESHHRESCLRAGRCPECRSPIASRRNDSSELQAIENVTDRRCTWLRWSCTRTGCQWHLDRAEPSS